MIQWRERFYIVMFILAAIALSAVARAQGSTEGLSQTIVYMTPEEARFLELINNFRSKLGLATLKVHLGLQNAAQKHSTWMANQDATLGHESLNHNGPTPDNTFADRIVAEGYANYSVIGENIACGSETPEDTFKQFAFSPAHLHNMLNPQYRNIGIARAGNGKEDCPYYWTNDFGSKSDDVGANVTDLSLIATAIDSAMGNPQAAHGRPIDGQTTLQLLNTHSAELAPNNSSVQCMIPYSLGKGSVVTAINTNTTVEVSPNSDGYMMKLSYAQDGTQTRFQSYTIFGAAVVKNPFYPLLTVFSAPTTRVGGFMIQIDTQSGRAEFDPYPGHGGVSGLINCKVK